MVPRRSRVIPGLLLLVLLSIPQLLQAVSAPTTPDFTITPSPASLTVLVGPNSTVTLTLTSINNFIGSVNLAAISSPSAGLVLTCPASVLLNANLTATSTCTVRSSFPGTPGTYAVTFTGTGGGLTHSATVSVNVPWASQPAEFLPLLFPGALDTFPTGLQASNGSMWVAWQSDRYSSSTTNRLDILYKTIPPGGNWSLSNDADFTFVDFTIDATSPASALPGASATSTITLTALSGFAGTVALTDSVPAGLTCGAITPASVAPPFPATASFSCSSTTAGAFSVTVNGTSGSLVHSTTANFTFGITSGFAVTATSPASVPVGTSATSTITVTAVGFAGTVALTDTVPVGLTCGAITPASVAPPFPATATLSCSSTTAGTFSVKITGASGTLVRSTTATFTFGAAPDFSITATSPAAVNLGQSATSTITVTPLNGFAGTVALTDTVPVGLTCGAITPLSVIPPFPATATVSCSSATAGTFTLTITGTSGTLVHTATATFTTIGYDETPALVQLNNGTILLFWASIPAHTWNIYYKRFNNNLWSGKVQLTSGLLNDTLPSAAVASDGSVWLTWTRSNDTIACVTCSTRQLYYKTLKAGVWSQEVQLTSDTNWNWGSSVMVGTDGKVRVVWAKGPRSPPRFQIFYKVYNGTAWGSDTQITTLSPPFLTDLHPSIMQDRNGTVWVFWQRRIQVTLLVTKWAIFGRASADMGASWSERQITDPPCVMGLVSLHCFVDQMPWAVQSTSDKSISIFYTGNQDGSGSDIRVLKSVPISPVHNVAISFIKSSNSLQYTGGLKSIGQSPIVTISVTVVNLGDLSETVQASIVVSNTTSYSLGPLSASVIPGGSVILNFNWNTTGVKPALYKVSATVNAVPGQTLGNLFGNTMLVKNLIRILPWGDIDKDGNIDLLDVSVVFFGYGSTPGTPRWNPLADIDGDGFIDIIDAGVVARNFGFVS